MGKAKVILKNYVKNHPLPESEDLEYVPVDPTGQKITLNSKNKIQIAEKVLESDNLPEGDNNKYLSAAQKTNLEAKKTITEGLPIIYYEDSKLKQDGNEITISASSGLDNIQFIEDGNNLIMKKKVLGVWKEVKRWTGHTP